MVLLCSKKAVVWRIFPNPVKSIRVYAVAQKQTHSLGGRDSFTRSLYCTWPTVAWSTRAGLFTLKIQWQIRVLRVKVRYANWKDAGLDSREPEIMLAATYLSVNVQYESSI